VTCDPDDSIDEVMQTMTSGRFRHLPVVRHGELLGLVSIATWSRRGWKKPRHEAEALKAYIVAGWTLRLFAEIMPAVPWLGATPDPRVNACHSKM